MSIAAALMSRPGSVMGDINDRPGSSLSTIQGLISPTKTPSARQRGLLRGNSLSLNAVNNVGSEPKNEYNGERIRELEGIINNQQEDFAQKMQDLEKVIKKQEETIVLMKGKMD